MSTEAEGPEQKKQKLNGDLQENEAEGKQQDPQDIGTDIPVLQGVGVGVVHEDSAKKTAETEVPEEQQEEKQKESEL